VDRNVAVSIVLPSASTWCKQFQLSAQEKREIEGNEHKEQNWTDEFAEGRRTVKLTMSALDLRDKPVKWNEKHDWLYNRLEAMRRVLAGNPG
jgi:hypothetical protein